MRPSRLTKRSARHEGCPGRQLVRAQDGGAVQVLALLLTGFLLLLGASLLTIASGERQVGSNDRNAVQALYLAEAAVERARRLLPRLAADDILVNNLLLGDWVNGASMASGTYRAAVTNNLSGVGGLPQDGGTAVCGGTTCDTDGLIVLTGTGSFRGAQRVVRAVVEIPPILRPPGLLTIVNAEVDPLFEGESFLVSGFDRNIDGTAGLLPARPSLAVTTSGAASSVQGVLTSEQQTRVLGAGATPSIDIASNAPTSDTLQHLKLRVAPQADRVLVNPGTVSYDLLGADGAGLVTLIKGDPSADTNQGLDTAGEAILDGTGHGSGVLVVTGQLTLRGSYRFDGVLLLVGDGSRLVLEGDAVINGSIFIANRTTGNLGRAGIAIKDRAQAHFSQEALVRAGRLLSARLRSWQEILASQ